MRVGIDLDGCVYDFIEAFRLHMCEKWGHPRERYPEPDRWEAWESWGMSKEEWQAEFHHGVTRGVIFREGEPYPGALDALCHLRDGGHTLNIVTHRTIHPSAVSHTAEWLDRYKVPHDTVTFSEDKCVIPCDVFIEDNVPNMRALAEAGVKVALLDRPWNQLPVGSLPRGARRVYSWEEFTQWVDALDRGQETLAAEVSTCSTCGFSTDEGRDFALHECGPHPYPCGRAICLTCDRAPEPDFEPRRPESLEERLSTMRTFSTGATRNDDSGKPDYEGFLSPLALRAFGEYMHRHRVQADGSLRDSDNWQKGIPLDAYMKSLLRHVVDVWTLHRGHDVDDVLTGEPVTLEEALCAVLFNTFGYLHQLTVETDG